MTDHDGRRSPNAPAYFIGRPAAFWMRVMRRPATPEAAAPAGRCVAESNPTPHGAQ